MVVADVVVARDRVPGDRQPVQLLAAILQIAEAMCTVQAEVAEVDDYVGGGSANLAKHGVPVRLRLGGGRRQVSVRDEYHRHSRHSRTLPAYWR